MDVRMLRSLRWVLIVGGVAGLFCAGSMLLFTLMQYGHSSGALKIWDKLPDWAVCGASPPTATPMLIAGCLCAVLLVAGRWPIKACAFLTAAWFIYAQRAFGHDSRWALQMAEQFEFTPFYVGGLVSVAALVVVSVLAFVIAASPTRAAQPSLADVDELPLSDPAQPPAS